MINKNPNPNPPKSKSKRRRRKRAWKRRKISKSKPKSMNSLIWDFLNNNPYRPSLLLLTISKLLSNSSSMAFPSNPPTNNPMN